MIVYKKKDHQFCLIISRYGNQLYRDNFDVCDSVFHHKLNLDTFPRKCQGELIRSLEEVNTLRGFYVWLRSSNIGVAHICDFFHIPPYNIVILSYQENLGKNLAILSFSADFQLLNITIFALYACAYTIFHFFLKKKKKQKYEKQQHEAHRPTIYTRKRNGKKKTRLCGQKCLETWFRNRPFSKVSSKFFLNIIFFCFHLSLCAQRGKN